MGLEKFILTCEKDNKELRYDLSYYKSYSKRLKEKNEKYKEVIDKAIECISELDDNTDDTTCYDIDKSTRDYILSILKEVEHEQNI